MKENELYNYETLWVYAAVKLSIYETIAVNGSSTK